MHGIQGNKNRVGTSKREKIPHLHFDPEWDVEAKSDRKMRRDTSPKDIMGVTLSERNVTHLGDT